MSAPLEKINHVQKKLKTNKQKTQLTTWAVVAIKKQSTGSQTDQT